MSANSQGADGDVDEKGEDSLRDEIAAAISGDGVADELDSHDGESGGVAAVADAAASESAADASSAQSESHDEAAVKKAPQSWKAEMKERFNALDPSVQDEILRRESDYNKGIQKYAESAKYAESIKPAMEKWQPYLSQLDVPPAQAFDVLIQAEYNLRHGSPDQKMQAFMKLANDYGVDVGQIAAASQGQHEVQRDPNIDQAFKRVQMLENYIRNQQFEKKQELEQNQQKEQSELHSQIEKFSSDPKHPHFEQVREDMAKLLQAGYAETLDEAYEKAIWARQDIRSTLLNENEANRIKEKAKVASQAKAKAVSVKGSPSGAAVPIANASIRDDLRAAIEAAGGRL